MKQTDWEKKEETLEAAGATPTTLLCVRQFLDGDLVRKPLDGCLLSLCFVMIFCVSGQKLKLAYFLLLVCF